MDDDDGIPSTARSLSLDERLEALRGELAGYQELSRVLSADLARQNDMYVRAEEELAEQIHKTTRGIAASYYNSKSHNAAGSHPARPPHAARGAASLDRLQDDIAEAEQALEAQARENALAATAVERMEAHLAHHDAVYAHFNELATAGLKRFEVLQEHLAHMLKAIMGPSVPPPAEPRPAVKAPETPTVTSPGKELAEVAELAQRAVASLSTDTATSPAAGTAAGGKSHVVTLCPHAIDVEAVGHRLSDVLDAICTDLSVLIEAGRVSVSAKEMSAKLLRERLERQRTVMEEARAALVKLEEGATRLESENEAAAQILAAAQSQCEAVSAEYTSSWAPAKTNQRREATAVDHARLEEELRAADVMAREEKAAVRLLQSEVDRLAAEDRELVQKVEGLRSALNTAKRDQFSVEAEYDAAMAATRAAESRAAEFERATARAEADLSAARARLEVVTAQVDAAESRIQSLSASGKQSRGHVDEVRKQVSVWTDRLATLDEADQAEQQCVTQLEHEIVELKQKVHSARRDLALATQEKGEVTASLQYIVSLLPASVPSGKLRELFAEQRAKEGLTTESVYRAAVTKKAELLDMARRARRGQQSPAHGVPNAHRRASLTPSSDSHTSETARPQRGALAPCDSTGSSLSLPYRAAPQSPPSSSTRLRTTARKDPWALSCTAKADSSDSSDARAPPSPPALHRGSSSDTSRDFEPPTASPQWHRTDGLGSHESHRNLGQPHAAAPPGHAKNTSDDAAINAAEPRRAVSAVVATSPHQRNPGVSSLTVPGNPEERRGTLTISQINQRLKAILGQTVA